MARNYAALPHDYLEEMEDLNDAEFGRLARALLTYSKTGETVALSGNERFFYRRVIMQEQRFQNSYETTSARNKENGKMGGRPKKRKEPSETKENPQKPTETQKTETETETKTKTEINTLPATAGKSNARAAVAAAFLDRINPSASQSSLEELSAFAEEMGQDVCLRAMDIALDAKAANWNYIRGILRNWKTKGVKCLADIERLDKKPETRQSGGKFGKGPACSDYSAPDAGARLRSDMDELFAMMGGGSG